MFKKGYTPWNKGKSSWNKGISNTWYNMSGLKMGWEAKKDLLKNRLTKYCAFCGGEFRVPRSLDRIKFCSRTCFGLNERGRVSPMKGKKGISGSSSPHWKGGITPKTLLERSLFKSNLHGDILKRDNFTCQLCGSRGKSLQVDHIKGWSNYPELRFDPNNCRTLCINCHYFVTFGRKMSPKSNNWGHFLKGGPSYE